MKKKEDLQRQPFNVNNYSLDRIFFSHHGARSHGYFKMADQIKTVKDAQGRLHPVVYSGKYGHASHFSSSPFFRIKTFDWTNDNGPIWRT